MDFIIGSAGFAKEVFWLLNELGVAPQNSYQVKYFVAKDNVDEAIDECAVIDEDHFSRLLQEEPSNNAFISIGSPAIKKSIYDRFKESENLKFPNIIHPSVIYDHRKDKLKMGEGNIICAGNILTTAITLGSYVHLNLGCTLGHDSIIGDFVTVSPGCHISGNVKIGERVFIGTGAVILEKVSICDDVIIGAGAVVAKSITESGTYVGVPVKKIK
jgi:sugar O-acyltransferase (sialic acid O-acetyltransferase NeuD family)